GENPSSLNWPRLVLFFVGHGTHSIRASGNSHAKREAGRARHSVRAVHSRKLCGAQGLTRPTLGWLAMRQVISLSLHQQAFAFRAHRNFAGAERGLAWRSAGVARMTSREMSA